MTFRVMHPARARASGCQGRWRLEPLIEREFAVSGRSPRAVISVVTKGELKSLAHKFGWNDHQHERLDAMLSGLPAADISHFDHLEPAGVRVERIREALLR